MRIDRGKEECVVVETSAATHHARHFFPANRTHKYINLYVQYVKSWSLLLVRRHREEQLLDAAIVPLTLLEASCRAQQW